MCKSDIRKAVFNRVKRDEVQDIEICEKVIETLKKEKCTTVFAYISVGNEVDTYRLIHKMLACGIRVCIPKIVSRGNMVAVEITDTESLVPDKFGIPSAPSGAKEIPKDEIHAVITPGVAFTEKGHRLGRGGGYYDRYLADGHFLKLGICYREQIVEDIPVEPHDAVMDILITG